jgi:anti-sigma-K factor RskA
VVLLVALLGSIWWGIGQRDDKESTQEELERIRTELVEQSGKSNAIAYRLTVTPNGPANASGTAFMPLSGSGVLSVVNLTAPPDGQTYQLWYFRDDSTPPIAGGTFTVDATGVGYMLIPADVGSFGGVGISIEPEGGSQSPTTPMILQGSVSGARG